MLDELPGGDPGVATRPRVVPTLTVDARPVLSYAMAHNEIPVISRLAVDGVPADAPAARVCLEVADAAGPIGAAQEVLVDLRAGEPSVLTDLTLTLDAAAMLQVEEQRPGAIRARLLVGDELWAERVVRTRVLAAHQWLATPTALALELLAAHVMPNHPAVTVLMGEVAELLARSTGSPSIQGYQDGPERVDAIVGAVYAAMAARGIRYAEPPASWADVGQKVRTPGEVLDERVGTCLDTVVVMAAALEQAGVRPLLWLVDGHAFLGWWREESSLGAAVETEAAGMVNQVDLHRVGLVETTALTRRAEPVPFARACRVPRSEHLADLGGFLGVLDVHQARRDAIVPLPARTRGADGQVVITTYTPAAAGPAPVRPEEPGRTVPGRPAEPPRVTRWKNALLDLSLRNRLINFTARAALPLAVPGSHLGALEDLLHQGRAVTLRPSDEVAAVDVERGVRSGFGLPEEQRGELLDARRTVYAEVTEAAYAHRLRSLAYKARTIAEETGANNLYLALGTLEWSLDGRGLRSPLVLVPVTLAPAGRGGRYRVALDEAGSSTQNYCLVEKLRQTHGLTIPEPPEDHAGIDLAAAFEAVRLAIAEQGLPFRVEPTADLAILQFAKFRLWKDLDEQWPVFARNPLVRHLVETPTDAFADPVEPPQGVDLDELDERCPVPADASQLQAVAEATAGRTFVLEGPPGTGKSQTITNLLAHAVASGRRVLFVAEKRAALDVVQARLDAVGMGPLSLDLHDKGSKPAAVREQIARALEHAAHPDLQDHAIRTEELRSARRGLVRYPAAVHEANAAGLSLYGARNAELAIGDEVDALPVPEALLAAPPGTVERLRQLCSTLPEPAEAARPGAEHPWAFVDVAARVDVPAAEAAARRVDDVLPALPAALGPALGAARSPADLQILADVVASRLPLAVLDESRTGRWQAAVAGLVDEVRRFAVAAHPGLDVVTPGALALPLREIDADARAAAASGFLGRRKRLVAVRERLDGVLRPGVEVAPRRLPELTAALVALDDGVRALAGRIAAVPGLGVPEGWSPFGDRGALEERVAWVRRTGERVDPQRGRFAEAVRQVVGAPADPRPVQEAAHAGRELLRACGADPAALAAWAGDAGLLGRWHATRAARAGDALPRWVALLAHVEPLRGCGMDEARAAVLSGALDPDDARRAFELGLARASLRERHAGRLERFDARVHERTIARFVGASATVRRHLATVVPHEVLAGRGFDPRATGGQVGELLRELKKKRGPKVRELMTRYGEVVTRAMPCVLVSPDSLARFFPAVDGLFDVVVFDEASQVRVADAIGAMGRARSVVVVGDSRQMPPTSFAESTVVEDDEQAEDTDVVDDEESILTECVQARVARHRLT